ncbi:hypothetical protein SDC9_191468 [bioreactor metagenome]|uniref:Uncharacterized protein n=1 Tax=bioreactor metagenome TaxID=1076179 RepID=A0A645HY25_9ZZZZ
MTGKVRVMKRTKAANVVKGVGIAMAIGGATAWVGSTMMETSKMGSIKKSASKAMKSVSNFMESM